MTKNENKPKPKRHNGPAEQTPPAPGVEVFPQTPKGCLDLLDRTVTRYLKHLAGMDSDAAIGLQARIIHCIDEIDAFIKEHGTDSKKGT